MTGDAPDPGHFFNASRFADTSKTGPWLDRLNARCLALIFNRGVLRGAHVRDLGNHDGQFTFAALKSGAQRAVGIELNHRLLKAARGNMEACDVPRERYDLVLRDIAEVEPFDVVLSLRDPVPPDRPHVRALEDRGGRAPLSPHRYSGARFWVRAAERDRVRVVC